MDIYNQHLPELRQFILPGGSQVAALGHLGRTVCRRAERRVVDLAQQGPVQAEIVIYLNRLSDFLFMLSRFWNFMTKTSEVTWKHD